MSQLPAEEATTWVSAQALGAIFEQPEVEVVDFLGYIPKSRRCPCDVFERDVDRLAAELAESGRTVVFVDKLGGAFAVACARWFTQHVRAKFKSPNCKVSVLEGGFVSWEAPNFPGAPYAGLLHVPLAPGPGRPPSPGSKRAAAWPLAAQKGGLVEEQSPGTLAFLTSLVNGNVVWIFSTTANAWIQACVISSKDNLLKVQYFISGQCCVKVLPRDSTHVKAERPEA